MTDKTASKPAQKSAPRQQVRQAITLELVGAITPSDTKAEQMAATFGLEPVAHASIRENVEEHVVRIANELRDNLNDKAMAIFLQRIVGSFVNAAHGAAGFYGAKKSDALGLNSRLLNNAQDEDREGPRASRARPPGLPPSPPRWACRPRPCMPPPRAPSAPTAT